MLPSENRSLDYFGQVCIIELFIIWHKLLTSSLETRKTSSTRIHSPFESQKTQRLCFEIWKTESKQQSKL